MSIFLSVLVFFFFFNDTATTEIYTLSLHDALPISHRRGVECLLRQEPGRLRPRARSRARRSEEHTSELQSLTNLVCRLLLEKKKKDPPFHVTNSAGTCLPTYHRMRAAKSEVSRTLT